MNDDYIKNYMRRRMPPWQVIVIIIALALIFALVNHLF